MSMTEWAEKEIELALAIEIAAIENDPEETCEELIKERCEEAVFSPEDTDTDVAN